MKKWLGKTITCVLVGCIITVCLAVIASEMSGGKLSILGIQEKGILVLLGVPAIFILTSQLMKMVKLLMQSSHEA